MEDLDWKTCWWMVMCGDKEEMIERSDGKNGLGYCGL
jgi:hypothetical protein